MISQVAENRRLKGIAAQVTAPPALADIEDVAAASCASCPHAHHQTDAPAAAADGVEWVGGADGVAQLRIGSGRYVFEASRPAAPPP